MRYKKVPEGWRIVKLSEVAEVGSGDSAPQGQQYFRNGVYPFVRTYDVGQYRITRNLVQSRDRINDIAVKELKLKQWPPKTILFPKSGAAIFLNNRAMLGVSAYVSSHLATILPKDSSVTEYIYYLLCTVDAKNLVPDNSYPSLRIEDLENIDFLLPPLPEQSKIAEILSSVDSVIEKTQAVIDQTQVLKKGLMQELFNRGIPGRHKKFKKTEIGEISEEWKVAKVGDLISLCQYGLNNRLSSEPIGIPILRMNNLVNGKIDTSDIKYAILSQEKEREYLLEFGDLLFNRTNSRDLVGKVAICKDNQKMSFASYLLRLKVNPDKAEPRWLNYYFNTDEVMTKLRHLATPGVSQSNINSKVMQALKLAIPSLEEQKEIADSIDLIDERINREIQIKEKLGFLKFALMQSLLTGEIRVKV